MGVLPFLVMSASPRATFSSPDLEYNSVLALTEGARAMLESEQKTIILRVLNNTDGASNSLSENTRNLFSVIIMLSELEQSISSLTDDQKTEYAIGMFLLKTGIEPI